MNLVNAYVIYNASNNTYIDDGSLVTLNCNKLTAFIPRKVWLTRTLPSGDGTDLVYGYTFGINSTDITQYGTNLIQGFYVEQEGKGFVIDVLDANTFIAACNACCDDSPPTTLARYYTSGIPLFSYPTEQKYCITRADDGTVNAHQEAALAYTSQIHGNVRLKSNISGVSKYEVTSFTGWPPTALGSDTIAIGYCAP